MNRRQKKKELKKFARFINSWAFSYAEARKMDREYHNFMVATKRRWKMNNVKQADTFKF